MSPSAHGRRTTVGSRAGFSLIEICLALGIVAFALIPLVGLLTVGLDSYRNANMRGRAAQVVSKISSAIRLGTVTTPGNYAAAPPFDAITWTVKAPADTKTTNFSIYFDENGEITPKTSTGTGWNPPRMVAMVVLTPPTTQFDPGKAQVALAWPALGDPKYTASTGITFVAPQGHDETIISFVSNSP